VRQTHDLAQKLGAQLGAGQILQRQMPGDRAPGRAVSGPLRRLVLVLGDQLWMDNPALGGFDPAQDRVLMIEAPGEGTQVWSHKARIALFLSAMRHFCNDVHRQGWPYTYVRLDDMADLPTFQARLLKVLQDLKPQMLVVCEPGEWRMLCAVQDAARDADVGWQVLPDTHFMCSREEFARWAGDKKELRMEFFYRDMRRRHGVLMNAGQPEGGSWNFDAENRKGWPAGGPGDIPEPAWFEPDSHHAPGLRAGGTALPRAPGIARQLSVARDA
jgi:deoxyribodipyrimidine photolyase-related protein